MKYLVFIITISFSYNIHAIEPDPKTVPLSATQQATEPKIRLSAQAPPKNGDAKIRIMCRFAKAGRFDPIVHAGEPNSGHHHTFFGNTNIAPNSSGASLVESGGSTCMGGSLVRSSFWIPSTVDTRTNKFVMPSSALIYYQTFRYGKNTYPFPYIQEIPQGLKILSERSSPLYKNPPFEYACVDPKTGKTFATSTTSFPTCNQGIIRYTLANWPECWDGKNLDSPDHKSHMAFKFTGDWRSQPNECPTTHPVRIPQVLLHVYYRVNEAGETKYWRLSSDTEKDLSGSTLHADYMGGIDSDLQKVFIENCNRAHSDCGVGKLGFVFDSLLGSETNGKLYELNYP